MIQLIVMDAGEVDALPAHENFFDAVCIRCSWPHLLGIAGNADCFLNCLLRHVSIGPNTPMRRLNALMKRGHDLRAGRIARQ